MDVAAPMNVNTTEDPDSDWSVDDRDMAMGSSRATGGIFRGRAVGNTESIADMGILYIYLFQSLLTNCSS